MSEYGTILNVAMLRRLKFQQNQRKMVYKFLIYGGDIHHIHTKKNFTKYFFLCRIRDFLCRISIFQLYIVENGIYAEIAHTNMNSD